LPDFPRFRAQCLRLQIQKFEKDRLDYDANLSKLKETVAAQKQEIVDLMAQVRPGANFVMTFWQC
jgi:ABC-type Zn2+ transport system substrate-binding protein/surface adhesin